MDHRRVILMQWLVILVLVTGGGAAAFMLLKKTDEYHLKAIDHDGSVASLKEQVRQARAAKTPDAGAPLPEATANGPVTPTATSVPTVKK